MESAHERQVGESGDAWRCLDCATRRLHTWRRAREPRRKTGTPVAALHRRITGADAGPRGQTMRNRNEATSVAALLATLLALGAGCHLDALLGPAGGGGGRGGGGGGGGRGSAAPPARLRRRT